MKTVQEKIAIMQAYVDGKEIEIFCEFQKGWQTWNRNTHPSFDWGRNDYRIAEDYELKAYNLCPDAGQVISLDPTTREWMRKIINAVKAGEIQ